MSVQLLREHGVERRRRHRRPHRRHLARGARPPARARPRRRARPVQRRALPRGRRRHRRLGHDPGLADAHHARPATRCATCSRGWAPRSRSTDDGLTVRGTGAVGGLDADLQDVGELAPVLAAVCAVATSPSRLRGIGHLRGHETDRLAALAREITRLGGERRGDRRRPPHHAEAPARRRLRDVRRPPHGHRGRGARARRARRRGGRRRHHRQDAARLRRRCGPPCSPEAPPREQAPRPRRGRRPRASRSWQVAAAQQGAAQARGRRPGVRHRRRSRSLHRASSATSTSPAPRSTP